MPVRLPAEMSSDPGKVLAVLQTLSAETTVREALRKTWTVPGELAGAWARDRPPSVLVIMENLDATVLPVGDEPYYAASRSTRCSTKAAINAVFSSSVSSPGSSRT